MNPISFIWNTFFLDPMLNTLVVLSWLFQGNFGLAIVVFTVLVRVVMLPLTLKQLHATKAMSALAPELQAIQRKYAKDRQRASQETMRLYREHGISPAGCLVPTLVQFPIWIGLYQSILQALAINPESLMSLSQHLYSWLPSSVLGVVPLENQFLWLDLARPDPWFVLAILVGISTWVQQKMATLPTGDPRQEATNRMMGTMMPFMMGYFTVFFPSGLALYWLVSNVISIIIQYFVTGWGSLAGTIPSVGSRPQAGEEVHAQRGDQRQDRRGGRGTGPAPTRSRPVSGRNRRS